MSSQVSKKNDQNKNVISTIIAIIAIGIVFLGFYYFNNSVSESVFLCKETLKNSLKSPGSAKFDGIEEKEVMGLSYVRGYVDSQNGFGALIRTRFVCMPLEESSSALIYTDTDNDLSDFNKYNDLFEKDFSEDEAIDFQKQNLDEMMEKLNNATN